MFGLIKQNGVDKKIVQMNNLLMKSFSNVKNDTQNIFKWLSYFHQKNMEQEHLIKQLQIELSYLPKRPEDVKRIIDSYYSFDNMMDKINSLNRKVDTFSLQKPVPQVIQREEIQSSEIEEIERRIMNLEDERKATMREKVVKRVTKNSRDYVKSLILSYIRKYTEISGLQLKEMVVIDQGLCSKSSFYRMLEELESLEEIGVVRRGKQKFYVFKVLKHH